MAINNFSYRKIYDDIPTGYVFAGSRYSNIISVDFCVILMRAHYAIIIVLQDAPLKLYLFKKNELFKRANKKDLSFSFPNRVYYYLRQLNHYDMIYYWIYIYFSLNRKKKNNNDQKDHLSNVLHTPDRSPHIISDHFF